MSVDLVLKVHLYCSGDIKDNEAIRTPAIIFPDQLEEISPDEISIFLNQSEITKSNLSPIKKRKKENDYIFGSDKTTLLETIESTRYYWQRYPSFIHIQTEKCFIYVSTKYIGWANYCCSFEPL